MKIFKSFYLKISTIFLCLIILLGTVVITITFTASAELYVEVEQTLNREYANSIAIELQPILEEGFSHSAVKDAIHYMMVLNPMVEIYIVNSQGIILAYFTGPGGDIVIDRIDLKPVRQFISGNHKLPIFGDDPRAGIKQKTFTAATLKMGDKTGYVYVILRGGDYDKSIKGASSEYYFKAAISAFLLAVFLTVVAGLILFFISTRKLRMLNHAVKDFRDGNYKSKVYIKGADEVSYLAETFNEMADSISISFKKLQNADREKSELITNISHDLRSPLTSIKGNIETVLIKNSSFTDEEREECLTTILRNVDNYQLLLDKLFQLVKLENNQIQFQRELFDIAELCHDVVIKLKNRADKINVKLIMHKPDHVPLYNGDISMIERALTNILENSINFSRNNGIIELIITKNNEGLRIVISDNGVGISCKDLPYIFNRFYKTDLAPNRVGPGSGLGLTIAKEIVNIHNGSIEVNSEIDKGSEFIILLPV